MTLTRGKILTLAFSGHHAYVSMRLDARNAIVAQLFKYLILFKSYAIFWQNTAILTFWPPGPQPLRLGQFLHHSIDRAVEELSSFFPWSPINNSCRDNGTFPEKYGISLNPTFDDPWCPRYWSEQKHDQLASTVIITGYRMPFSASLFTLGFRDRGGGWNQPLLSLRRVLPGGAG